MPAREPDVALLTHYRRDLHRIPEVGFDLPETISYVRQVLEGLVGDAAGHGGKLRIGCPSKSCVCALFDAGSAHATAVRADMDALPVVEHSGVSFASEHAGRMQACGHDGYMALALGLANWLALHPDRMSRSVLLVFEPAEETTGGARCVIESGVLARCGVDRIFGFHLWPDLPKGSIASRPGALLAASNEVNIEIAGRASHIAKAELGADALEAAARVLLASYDYVRKLQKTEPCLLKFGRMQAGRVRNQIAAASRLEGSLRSFSETVRDHSEDELRCIASQQAEALGCSAQTDFSEGYPPVINDAALFGLATEALPELSELARPLLISDDFAWYQRKTPGVFLLLGTGTGIPLHSDEFRFDESVLSAGLSAYQRLVCLP